MILTTRGPDNMSEVHRMGPHGSMMYSNMNRTPAAYNMMYHNSMAGTASPLAQMAAELDISSLLKMEAHTQSPRGIMHNSSESVSNQSMACDAYLECMFGLAHTQQLKANAMMGSTPTAAPAHHNSHHQPMRTQASYSASCNASRSASPEPQYRMTAHSAHTSPVPYTAASPQLALSRNHTGSYGVATAAHYSPMLSSADTSPVLSHCTGTCTF